MKIAKMSYADLEEVRRRARRDKTQILAHLVMCYETMFDNACDPTSEVLEFKPLDMIIFCPHCKTQHVDEPNPGMCMDCGHIRASHALNVLPAGSRADVCAVPGCMCKAFNPWTNPPHRKHRCQNAACNKVFAVTATLKTNGVKELPA